MLGELDGRITPRLEALHTTIRDHFEPNAIMSDAIQGYLWGKLGYASLLFAQALGQLGIADCLARPELLPLWRGLAGEVFNVATALDVRQRGFNGFDPAAFAPTASEAEARASVDAMVTFNRPAAKTHSGNLAGPGNPQTPYGSGHANPAHRRGGHGPRCGDAALRQAVDDDPRD